jgi:cation channel sperm-associated protein 3
LEDLLAKLQETVRHDDIFPTHNLCCDLTWIETYLITLNHQENSIYRIQQTHFEIANTLAEWLERRQKMKKGQN